MGHILQAATARGEAGCKTGEMGETRYIKKFWLRKDQGKLSTTVRTVGGSLTAYLVVLDKMVVDNSF